MPVRICLGGCGFIGSVHTHTHTMRGPAALCFFGVVAVATSRQQPLEPLTKFRAAQTVSKPAHMLSRIVMCAGQAKHTGKLWTVGCCAPGRGEQVCIRICSFRPSVRSSICAQLASIYGVH